MPENSGSQEAKAEQLFRLVDEAAKLPRDCGQLEEKAVDAFVAMLTELKKRRQELYWIAEKRYGDPQRPFASPIVCEGIFLGIKKRDIYLDVDGDLSELGQKICPRLLAKDIGAESCVDHLISAIRQRIDAIKQKRDSDQSAIAKAEAMFPK